MTVQEHTHIQLLVKTVHIAIRCENNTGKCFNGHIWLEPVESIVEHNGKTVTQPLDVSVLKQGDAVKVRWGKNKKLWNGVVAFLQEESPVTTSECEKPAERKRKRKTRPVKEQPKTRPKKIGKCIRMCTLYKCVCGKLVSQARLSKEANLRD